jgi:hypothetical protein
VVHQIKVKMDIQSPKSLFKKFLKKISVAEEVKSKLVDELTFAGLNEFYACVMHDFEKLDEKQRHPSGGISIAAGCIIYLWYLLSGLAIRSLAEKFGHSEASINRLLHQMAKQVGIIDFQIEIFYKFSHPSKRQISFDQNG